MSHHEICFGPFSANILDYVGHESLATPTGIPVEIAQVGTTFYITIGNKVQAMPNNLSASYLLNINQVGVYSRSVF